MKKIVASIAFIAAFAGYALYENGTAQGQLTASHTTSSLVATAQAALPPKKPAPSVIAMAQRKYRDGVYTGAAADAYYGNVQVQVTVTNGKIADVSFLDYPQDRGTSRRINSYAIPQLTQEAVSAQSASVDGVSGATDTSAAFRQSLASALSQAVA